MQLTEALKKYFGYNKFRPGQEEIIKNILQGENVLAVLPTGAGKSLCYQLPALVSDNFSIVISPLIALMKSQVDSLKHLNELAAFINSTMSFNEAEEVLQNIAHGKTKILYAAPERLESLNFAERIKNLNPTFLFIDEAHCISEWGHNFRPSYSKIKNFIGFTGIKNISAFTATATPEVVGDIVKQLELKSPKIFVRGFERDNLHLNVIITKKKKRKCIELISRFNTPAIIYTSSRKITEEISEFLNLHRIKCAYYHAGLQNIHRKKIQEDFLNGELPVIAATNAFGMGIDKKDIRLIIHYNTPGSIENYYQEIGRAGRDGKPSHVFLLHDDNDIAIQNYFIENSHPDKKLIQNIYNAICDYSKVAVGMKPEYELPVNLDYISSCLNRKISKSILHSALRILEETNFINQLSEFDNKIFLKFTSNKNGLKDFLKKSEKNLFREITLFVLREFGSSIFNNKKSISLSSLSNKSDYNENEIDDVLTTLDNLGFAEYSKPLSKENIVLTQPRVDSSKLVLNYKKLNENYLNLQKKLNLMIDYVYTTECRFKFILNYFGEDTTGYSCGKCDKCSGEKKVSEASFEYVKEIILKTIYNTGSVNETTLLRIIKGSSKTNKFSVDTFSACANYKKEDLKFIFHNLLSQEFLMRNSSNYKKVDITDDGRNYLISKNIIEEEKEELNSYEEDLVLFNLLREARKRVSRKFIQSGYLICPDEILREIVSKKPQNEYQILKINGFNQRMFNKLGEDFLDIIKKYLSDQEENLITEKNASTEIPQNIKETFTLLKKGYSLKEIASLRNLKEAVISMQIETIIEYEPSVDISKLFPQNIFDDIKEMMKHGVREIKELKTKLPDNIPYSIIRIAAAKVKFSDASYSSKHQYIP